MSELQVTEKGFPPCSEWRLWEGIEIEGFTDMGVTTLFIRDATKEELDVFIPQYERIFVGSGFVKAGISPEFMQYLKSFGKKLCFEIHFEDYVKLHNEGRTDIIGEHQVYLQINNFALKEGDHVKIGDFFKEEIFLSGTGMRTPFEAYFGDKFLA